MMEAKYGVFARNVEGVYDMRTPDPMAISPGDKIDIVNLDSGSVEVTIMCRNNANVRKPIRRFEGCHGCWAYAHITSNLCDATGCSENSPVWSFIRVDNLLEEL